MSSIGKRVQLPRVVLLANEISLQASSQYTIRLAHRLPEHGFEANVVCQAAPALPYHKRGKLKVSEHLHLNLPIWRQLVLRDMLAELKAFGPDLIHAQTRDSLSVGLWLANRLRIPLVLTIHEFLGQRDRFHFAPRHRGRIIAISAQVKSDLAKKASLSPDWVKVVHHGVDPDPPSEMGQSKEDHTPVVGMAGPLEPNSGQTTFLEAAEILRAEKRSVEFLIAGSGPDETRLRRFARDHCIAKSVTFITYLQGYTDALQAMDIFCMPTFQEGLGTLMFEAMARGRPVIASKVGGVSSMLHHREDGLLLPPGDAKALAQGIGELLDNPQLAKRLGQNGKKLIKQNFSVDKMVADTAAIYRKLLPKREAAVAKT